VGNPALAKEPAMNEAIIAAARRQFFTLDVASQIVGVPPRLIDALVSAHHDVDGVAVYRLRHVVAAFRTEAGVRLLRKLHQNQLQLYRNCEASWRDDLGTVRRANGAIVEIRGRRIEITLADGYRTTCRLADPEVAFAGTRV
jgi:hypothetical protein